MIYPPTLNSSLVAFVPTNSYDINFTLNKITSYDEIGHVLIRVVKKNLNTSIADTTKYPDGTIYKTKENILTTLSGYYISVLDSDLATDPETGKSWQPGLLYKILVRFGKTELWGNEKFAIWKQEQITKGTFSEWSTVMIVKAIDAPEVTIVNLERSEIDPTTLGIGIENTLRPLFMGRFRFIDEAINNEPEDKYRFDLYKGDELLDSSEWLQHTVDSLDTWTSKKLLEEETDYYLTYTVKTSNGYIGTSAPYHFMATESTLLQLAGVELYVDDQASYCAENGCINLYLTGKGLNGCYLITRASEKTNFTDYEELKYLFFFSLDFNKELIFLDFTVESGIKYKYAFLMLNPEGVRTAPLYPSEQGPWMVNFEYSYFYRDNVLLRLMFNLKLSSFKHTVLASKQDTLGGKYPVLSRNGLAYYAEFPISGTISLAMDEDLTFFEKREDGYYYRDELAIPADKFIDNDFVIDRNLVPDNIFVERRFREKVEEFLNDFNYKLYKSPTEGNIIVALLNVSLTPNATVGRMIFDFSATAYEVLDNTLDNLNTFGILNIGESTSLETFKDTTATFGLLNGLFSNDDELLNIIKKQVEVPTANGYRWQLVQITSLSILGYPHIDLNGIILELQAKMVEMIEAGKSIEEIEQLIDEYEDLLYYLTQTMADYPITIVINGKEIIVNPKRVYNIDEEVTSIKVKSDMHGHTPLILNYVCKLVLVKDKESGIVSLIDTSRLWGLIHGIFTDNADILKNYNYDYLNTPDYNVVAENAGEIDIYKTTNLMDIIKEKARKQIEDIYLLTDGFNNYDNETDLWDKDGDMYYHFDALTKCTIEAKQGTTLLIGAAANNTKEITIGKTGIYTITDPSVNYISFKSPAFAIVNYICNTTLLIIKKGSE